MVEPLLEYRWPSGDSYFIGALGLPLQELAATLGFPLQSWEEPGLGTAAGVFLRVRTGSVFLLQEFEHMRGDPATPGPDIFVDLGVAAGVGGSGLRAELLRALALPPSAFAFIPTSDHDTHASARFATLKESLAAKAQRPPTRVADDPSDPQNAT